jgi:hypothetical protein
MLWNYPTIEALTASLLERLHVHLMRAPERSRIPATEPEPATRRAQPNASLDAMLDELDELSEREIDAFFQRGPQRDILWGHQTLSAIAASFS